MVRSAEVERVINRVGELPAMPAVVADVLRVTEDPTSDMSAVSKAIQADPALTAKILRVSNSPYYGMKQYVGTLKLALVILGVREVRNIVLGISVFETVRDTNNHLDVVTSIWNDSLRVGGIAKNLGAYLGLGLQGEEFIAGLLSDIGKVAMLRQFGTAYLKLLESAARNDAKLRLLEQEVFACSHEEVAMSLANLWNLPETLCDALWFQYPSTNLRLSAAADPALAATVRIAKAARCDDFSQDAETLYSLADAEAWSALEKVKNPIACEERPSILRGYVDALSHAPAIPL